MDLFQLSRPDHIEQPAWDAIELARDRLKRAWEIQDLPEVIGKAKELVETVAKVAVAATGESVQDNPELAPLVKAAQRALKRQPGDNLSQQENVRGMAQAAQSLVIALGPIRNAYGTGHGRPRVPDIVDEMATLCLESALLWCRWALRRLGHLLADYPNDLIEAVQMATSRTALRKKFESTALAQQPSEVQHRIGVVFGQQSAGGFGNATEVGVEPAVDGGYDEYPIDYRRGLLEGMLLTTGRAIGMTDFYAPRFVSLLASLPETHARRVLQDLSMEIADAPWIDTWRGSTDIQPADVVSALRAEGERLPAGYEDAFDLFCDELLRTVEPDIPLEEI